VICLQDGRVELGREVLLVTPLNSLSLLAHQREKGGN